MLNEIKYEKIPCPNCANKIIAMVSGVVDGIEIYKCQVCKALTTYDHNGQKVLSVKTYKRKHKKEFKEENPL